MAKASRKTSPIRKLTIFELSTRMSTRSLDDADKLENRGGNIRNHRAAATRRAPAPAPNKFTELAGDGERSLSNRRRNLSCCVNLGKITWRAFPEQSIASGPCAPAIGRGGRWLTRRAAATSTPRAGLSRASINGNREIVCNPICLTFSAREPGVRKCALITGLFLLAADVSRYRLSVNCRRARNGAAKHYPRDVFDVKHLYARWSGDKLRRLNIQETLDFDLCRLRLALFAGREDNAFRRYQASHTSETFRFDLCRVRLIVHFLL
ncbi:hypothetical protein EVAR_36874_1 [Eumeta japonica]|uniref:Uncharacterized protein n=1 Tax=Eumeta variegata TaxID=151549 RepID=A0A4C1WRV4_EUMVA|nr:hypothetical protein EVAR_36874_1 [Eumeta japonica]